MFLFAMTCLVMADNLVLLYLGWEGVGFASYWLIGYFYQRPSAVAAAKKAFIVTRIGDVGLLVGILLIWREVGTFSMLDAFDAVRQRSWGLLGRDQGRFFVSRAVILPPGAEIHFQWILKLLSYLLRICLRKVSNSHKKTNMVTMGNNDVLQSGGSRQSGRGHK